MHLVLGARGRRDRYKRQGLGVAARAADEVWLTNEGTVLNRREAITAAVRAAGARDVVLVGRGHETRLQDDGEPVHLDDTEVAREALRPDEELTVAHAS